MAIVPVLDYPVILVVVGNPVPNHENSVIEITGTAAAVSIHTAGIELELVAGSINGHTAEGEIARSNTCLRDQL